MAFATKAYGPDSICMPAVFFPSLSSHRLYARLALASSDRNLSREASLIVVPRLSTEVQRLLSSAICCCRESLRFTSRTTISAHV